MCLESWARTFVSVKVGLLDQQAVVPGIGRRECGPSLKGRKGVLMFAEEVMSLLQLQ